MNDQQQKRKELASYRIKQAEESLDEARFLLSGQKSPRSVMNRAYYAMFYSVLALLIHEPYSSSKHSGVLSYFNKHFVMGGIFDKDLGRALNKAFELRLREDYREFMPLTIEQVVPFIDKSSEIIEAIKEYLKKTDKI